MQTLYEIAQEDHPRIRGTNSDLPCKYIKRAGSSPHTRDKLLVEGFTVIIPGIIPAYAGQIKLYFMYMIDYKDHPRIRGTNQLNR